MRYLSDEEVMALPPPTMNKAPAMSGYKDRDLPQRVSEGIQNIDSPQGGSDYPPSEEEFRGNFRQASMQMGPAVGEGTVLRPGQRGVPQPPPPRKTKYMSDADLMNQDPNKDFTMGAGEHLGNIGGDIWSGLTTHEPASPPKEYMGPPLSLRTPQEWIKPLNDDTSTYFGRPSPKGNRKMPGGDIGSIPAAMDTFAGLAGMMHHAQLYTGSRIYGITQGLSSETGAKLAEQFATEATPDAIAAPFRKIMQSMGYGDVYDNSTIVKVFGAVMGAVEDGGERLSKDTGGFIQPEDVMNLANAVMSVLGYKGSKGALVKAWAERKAAKAAKAKEVGVGAGDGTEPGGPPPPDAGAGVPPGSTERPDGRIEPVMGPAPRPDEATPQPGTPGQPAGPMPDPETMAQQHVAERWQNPNMSPEELKAFWRGKSREARVAFPDFEGQSSYRRAKAEALQQQRSGESATPAGPVEPEVAANVAAAQTPREEVPALLRPRQTPAEAAGIPPLPPNADVHQVIDNGAQHQAAGIPPPATLGAAAVAAGGWLYMNSDDVDKVGEDGLRAAGALGRNSGILGPAALGIMIPATHGQIRMAERFKAGGEFVGDIWKKARAFEYGNKWVTEISDHMAEWDPGFVWARLNPRSSVKLSDMLRHPELYAAEPWTKDIRVKLTNDPEIAGGISQDGKTIWLAKDTPEKMLESVIHELDHSVGLKYNMPRGASVAGHINPANQAKIDAAYSPASEALLTRVTNAVGPIDEAVAKRALTAQASGDPLNPLMDSELRKIRSAPGGTQLLDILEKRIEADNIKAEATEKYTRTAGEQMAEASAARRGLTPLQRSERVPSQDFTRPVGQHLFRYDDQPYYTSRRKTSEEIEAEKVKEKGGMWHEDAVARFAEPIARGTHGSYETRENFDWATIPRSEMGTGRLYTPEERLDIAMKTPGMRWGTWATKIAKGHLDKFAGTEHDPLNPIMLPAQHGYPARTWENMMDDLISGEQVRGRPLPADVHGPVGHETIWDISNQEVVGRLRRNIYEWMERNGHDRYADPEDILQENIPHQQREELNVMRDRLNEAYDAENRVYIARQNLTRYMERLGEHVKDTYDLDARSPVNWLQNKAPPNIVERVGPILDEPGYRAAETAVRNMPEYQRYLKKFENNPLGELKDIDLVRAAKELAAKDEVALKQERKLAMSAQKDLVSHMEFPDGAKWVKLTPIPETLTRDQMRAVRLMNKNEWDMAKVDYDGERALEANYPRSTQFSTYEEALAAGQVPLVGIDPKGKIVTGPWVGYAMGRTPQEAWFSGLLGMESAEMKHSVAGFGQRFKAYSIGAYEPLEQVRAGNIELYSLRKDGKSYGTAEVRPAGPEIYDPPPHMGDNPRNPRRLVEGARDKPYIVQIMGHNNGNFAPEFMKHGQDFVTKDPAGRQWGKVGYSEHVDLVKLGDRYVSREEFEQSMSGLKAAWQQSEFGKIASDYRRMLDDPNAPDTEYTRLDDAMSQPRWVIGPYGDRYTIHDIESVLANVADSMRFNPRVMEDVVKLLEGIRDRAVAQGVEQVHQPGRPPGEEGPPAGGGEQAGFVDPTLLKYGAGAAAGAALGGYVSSDDNKIGGALVGAGIGMLGMAARRSKDFLKQLDVALGSSSTRLGNYAESLKLRAREYERRTLTGIKEATDRAAPFLEGIGKLRGQVADDVRQALLENDLGKVTRLLATVPGGMGKAFIGVQDLLRDFRNSQIATGRFKAGLTDYFPRVVEDYEGLKASLGQVPGEALDKWMNKAEADSLKSKGRPMTDVERSLVINRYFLADAPLTSLPNHLRQRTVKNVTKQLAEFYEDPATSLVRYIHGAVEDLEMARFFGKDLKFQKAQGGVNAINIDKSVGSLVDREMQAGRMNSEQARDVKGILTARFGEGAKGASTTIQHFRNMANIGLLGNVVSAATQLGDIGTSVAIQGLRNTLVETGKALSGKSRVDPHDFGLANHISEEFSTPVGSARALNKVFRASGFTAVDMFGKKITMNAALRRYETLSKTVKGEERIASKYKEAFGNEYPALLDDLRNGRVSERVKALLFSELSDVQPISKFEMPQKYLEMPNGRVIYMLKTFMLKQMDVVRREFFQEYAKGNKARAMANLTRYALALGIGGATTDMLKDFMSGKPFDAKWSDIPLNILKTFGWSKYTLDKAKEGRIGTAAAGAILPPYAMIDDIIRRDPRAISYIPILGKLYYNREKDNMAAEARVQHRLENRKVRGID